MTYFNDRTLDTLQERFKILILRPARSRSIFTPEEDDLIVKAVESGMMVEEIGQLLERTTKSIKIRIRKIKDRLDQAPQIAKGRWYSVDDYELIGELVDEGVSWEDITTEYFPGRGSRSVRAAYNRHQAKKQKEEEEEEGGGGGGGGEGEEE